MLYVTDDTGVYISYVTPKDHSYLEDNILGWWSIKQWPSVQYFILSSPERKVSEAHVSRKNSIERLRLFNIELRKEILWCSFQRKRESRFPFLLVATFWFLNEIHCVYLTMNLLCFNNKIHGRVLWSGKHCRSLWSLQSITICGARYVAWTQMASIWAALLYSLVMNIQN